jgi:phytoene dehydrogenase-like protein
VHDLHAGFFPLTAASPAFAGLELERRGLEWITPPVPMVHPFLDGRAIVLHRSVPKTVAGLERMTPGAGMAWEALIAPLLAHGALVTRTALRTFPPVVPGSLLALKLGRRSLELGRLMLGSAASLGRELFDDPGPSAWLCGSVAHSDLSPGAAGGGAFAFALHWLGHLVGWPLPRGGAGRLSAAMVARLEETGGSRRPRGARRRSSARCEPDRVPRESAAANAGSH